MDFASLMSSQISKTKSSSSASPSNIGSKYVKRSDIEAARQTAYAAEQAKLEADREERAHKKRKLDTEEAERARLREEKKQRLAEESKRRREEEDREHERLKRKRLGLPDLPEVSDDKAMTLSKDEASTMSEAEVIANLRQLGQPATLFGENHSQRLKRYKKLQREMSLTDQRLSDGPIPTTLELVPEAEMQVPANLPPKDSDKRTFLFRQLASYFNMVLREWELALDRREQSVKDSSQGRTAYNAMVQSRTNMRPLFRKFETGEVEDGILEPVLEIVRCAQARRYVDASDGYLRLSIGKAAWPIGVTMVGIHERSAREKLHESDKNQAHIMSDEITRKFLQSIKRCLSFAQTRWPPDDQLQLMG
ncbi:MAG: hypothetical protein Q9160_002746 [Pyrenula sp. 1 TL-2023]